MDFDVAYQRLKNIYHWAQSQLWRARYGWPDRKLTLFGVTGTNGKTTTAILLGSILREQHGQEKIGLLTTEVFWFGELEETNTTHMTSTDAKVVWKHLQRMVDQGVTQVVLEMTSHALDQHRLAGVSLAGGIILNIQHEHLDYHHTMAAYAAAKARLADYLITGAPLVTKADDEWTARMAKKISEKRPDIVLIPYTSEEAAEIEIALPGDVNKENALAASLLAQALKIDVQVIAAGRQAVTSVPGRLQWMTAPNGARVVVDFALTPYAYEKLFAYLRKETKGRVIGVFGAAGRRDTDKRPLITKAVAQYADEIVLTQDEPYDDPEEEIYKDLEAGLTGATISWQRIEDRTKAIRYAVRGAQADDVVAVVGMGNFDSRMVGDKKIPWNDAAVIRSIFKEHTL